MREKQGALWYFFGFCDICNICRIGYRRRRWMRAVSFFFDVFSVISDNVKP